MEHILFAVLIAVPSTVFAGLFLLTLWEATKK
jgi:hypothetical protein